MCVLAAGCKGDQPAPNPGAPLPESATRAFRGCAADDECMFVQNGCCSCGNGGEELAINKQHEQAFLAQFKCNENFPCTLMARYPPCGSGKVSCKSGLCTYELP